MAVRHCHTQHFVEDLIKFVNFLFGDCVLDISYYIYKTIFTPSVSITKHYFCGVCQLYVGKDEDFFKLECPECKTSISDDSSSNYVFCSECHCCAGLIEDSIDNEFVQCPKCINNIDINSKVPECGAVCHNCKFYMVSKEKFLKKVKLCKCPKCNKEIDVKSITSGNYFITFSLREQLEELLSKPDLKFVSRTDRNPSVIADICDGEFYKNLMKPGCPLENENALTGTFNTDGVQVYENQHSSLYPIWFHINEVIPEQRFKQENLILGGLWFGESSPNMALFLEPFINELIELSANGVSRTLSNGTSVICPIYPLMCSVDSVCKPKIVCQKQFNGRMACLYCYHPNDAKADPPSKQRFYDQEVTYDLRTDEEVMRDMVKADKLQQQGLLKKDSVNGFVGLSILLRFVDLLGFLSCNTFSIVWGLAIDYMHAALEGVASDLFNIIANILSPDQLKKLDKQIEKITPPQAMTRCPRDFSKRSSWKAKEIRAMLLYYILPCLDGVLADKYYENLKLFANAMHILLSDRITLAQLTEAASCLTRFGVGYQRLYGIVNVSYNLHICRHFFELVRRFGPLWSYSNFLFESGNGYLLTLVRGTRSVINEIAGKHTRIKAATKLILGNHVSKEAIQFCGTILGHRYPKQNDELQTGPIELSHSIGEVTDCEVQLLTEWNVSVSENRTVCYNNRLINDGILYYSKSYTRATVHDDSCVQLDDGRFAVIDKLLRSSSGEFVCIIQPIRIAQGLDIIPSI